MWGIIELLSCMLLVCCGNMSENKNSHMPSSDSLVVLGDSIIAVPDTIPFYAKKVIEAYPDFDIKYTNCQLMIPDSTIIICDDGREKSFAQKLDDCDIEDMFSMTYDRSVTTPDYLSDCGRGRCELLFKKMYGNNEREARANLVNVNWFGQQILFTKVNGAAKQLEKVAAELANMPEMKKYLVGASSFYWRKVRGANRQSAHSYGIAIDINTNYSNYWLWSNPGKSETDRLRYENRIPLEIVDVFEKNGFIWGGRWYHYDTMHFEYRPEFLYEK